VASADRLISQPCNCDRSSKTGRPFVEWTATFDCESANRDRLRQNLEKMFSIFIASLSNAIESGDR
jgi:hypothetical protein